MNTLKNNTVELYIKDSYSEHLGELFNRIDNLKNYITESIQNYLAYDNEETEFTEDEVRSEITENACELPLFDTIQEWSGGLDKEAVWAWVDSFESPEAVETYIHKTHQCDKDLLTKYTLLG